MAAGWIELFTGSLEQKKKYCQYKARIKQHPANYRAAAEALERYLMYAGGIAKGDVAVRMYGDLVDLFEDSAANGTPIRNIVGEDPVEFVETFVANYSDGSWINKERDRLTKAIDRAAEDTSGGSALEKSYKTLEVPRR
jgi:DNA-binding ferritin-like protein (Dps family)